MSCMKRLNEHLVNYMLTVLFATSVDLAGTNASNDTVRRMHDDNVTLSNKCVLPANKRM